MARPRPLREMVANLDGASGGTKARAEARVRLRLRRAIRRGRPDVLYVVEASTAHGAVDLRAVIAQWGLTHVWGVSQDLRTAAHSGSAILYRRSRAEVHAASSRIGAPAILRGRRADRMRDRHLRRVVLWIDRGTKRQWRRASIAGHAPPKRNWAPWGDAWWISMRTSRAAVKAADFNRLRRYVVRRFPRRHVRMDGLMGVTVARWIPTSRKEVVHIGAGHKAVVTTVWPRAKKKR